MSEDCRHTNCLEAACLTAKREDLRSVSTGGKKFLPRKCNDKFCTQLTKVYAAEMSRISCYWFCYVSAHNQFTRLRSVASSRRCRWHAMIQSQLGLHSGVLKIVTRLTWEHIPNANICVGASRSYPFVFAFIMRITYDKWSVGQWNWPSVTSRMSTCCVAGWCADDLTAPLMYMIEEWKRAKFSLQWTEPCPMTLL